MSGWPVHIAALSVAALLCLPAVQSASVEVVPLQLEDVEVQVTIRDTVAVTEVFGSFINPVGIDLDVVARLPIPRDSELRLLSVVCGDALLEGELGPRAEATRLYRRGRRDGTVAGLVHHDPELGYQLRLSGARRGEKITWRVVCAQTLDAGAERRFVFPDLEESGNRHESTDDVGDFFPPFDLRARILMPAPVDALSVTGARELHQIEHTPGSLSLEARVSSGHARRLTIHLRLDPGAAGLSTELPFPECARPWIVDALRPDRDPQVPGPEHMWVLTTTEASNENPR